MIPSGSDTIEKGGVVRWQVAVCNLNFSLEIGGF
jgi:hypothetical protein